MHSTQFEQELEALWRFSLTLTGSRVTAEALLHRTCNRFYELRQTCNTRSSLYRLQHRIWRDEVRIKQLNSATTNDGNDASDSAPCFGNKLSETISQLPEEQRLAVNLVYAECFSYSEAADILDVSITTLMRRLAKARITIGGQQRTKKNKVQAAVSTAE